MADMEATKIGQELGMATTQDQNTKDIEMSETTTITDRHLKCAEEIGEAMAYFHQHELSYNPPEYPSISAIIAKHFREREPVAWLCELGSGSGNRIIIQNPENISIYHGLGYLITPLYK